MTLSSTSAGFANFKKLYLLLSVLLVIYVTTKAITMSFTHDESLTYTIIKGSDEWKNTANNHLLNTLLANFSSKIFGFSEISLRLPNVLSFIAYIYFVYKLVTYFTNYIYSSIISLPIFLLNPFVLDFFSLARGYGLAVSFFTGSLYFFILHINNTKNIRYILCAITLSIMCIYSNYAFISSIISLHIGAVFSYIRNKSFNFRIFSLFYTLECLLLYPAYKNVQVLKEHGELYFGGDKNIITDTFYSLIECSFQLKFSDNTNVIIFILCLLSFFIVMATPKSVNTKYIIVITALVCGIPIVLNALAGVKFPIERSTLYLSTLLGALVYCMVEDVSSENNILVKFSGIAVGTTLSVLHIVNFILSANLTHTYTWAYDVNTKKALAVLDQHVDHTKKYTLGASWLFYPAINYYRETKEYHWLEPVEKNNLVNKSQYYYVLNADSDFKPNECLTQLASFPDNNATLFESSPSCADDN